MLDGHGRTINYLRISLTDRCNLRCLYCMPEKGILKKQHEDILRFEEIIQIVKVFTKLGIKKVRYTGGEPLILENIDELISGTAKIKGIKDISMTTNGLLLGERAESLKRAGLNRVNISLDTLDKDKYKQITRGGDLEKVLNAIDTCIRIDMAPVKINTVVMKGINDNEIGKFIDLARELPIQVRFIELMPIGEGAKLYEKHFMSSEEILKSFPNLIPMANAKSSTAELYKEKGSKGNIGFISPLSCKFCSDCNKIRLTAIGNIKPCLHSLEEINIKEYIGNEALLTSILKEAIFNKPMEHFLETEKVSRSEKMMYQIGG